MAAEGAHRDETSADAAPVAAADAWRRRLRWLLPGLGLKRWLVLFALGLLLIGAGLAVMLNVAVVGQLELQLRQLLAGLGGPRAGVASGLGVAILGAVVIGLSLAGLARSILALLVPEGAGRAADRILRQRFRERGPKVVAIGGGTGLPVVLRGLKKYTSNLTAIVTVADDGGSSGRLRDRYGILPPGDIRNCLLALAETEPLMEQLFQHRFRSAEPGADGADLGGHSFGNLFLLAMSEVTGDFDEGIRASSQVLAITGRVLPSTLADVHLVAELSDGRVVTGESAIRQAGRSPSIAKPIRRVWLDPPDPPAQSDAVAALEEADLIVLAPGSLYTSLLPNLAVPGIALALRRSRALKVLVVNAMTEPGETDGMDALDHVLAVLEHVGPGALHGALVNDTAIPPDVLERYAAEGARPVAGHGREWAAGSRAGGGGNPVGGDGPGSAVPLVRASLLAGGDRVRHDPALLARTLMGLLDASRPRTARRLIDEWLFRP